MLKIEAKNTRISDKRVKFHLHTRVQVLFSLSHEGQFGTLISQNNTGMLV